MRQFLAGMVCGAALLFVAMHYHVVRGKNGTTLIPKISNNLLDVYVDVREFTLSDWQKHKPLAAAILQSEHADLLEDSSLNTFRESVRGFVDGLFRS